MEVAAQAANATFLTVDGLGRLATSLDRAAEMGQEDRPAQHTNRHPDRADGEELPAEAQLIRGRIQARTFHA